MIQTNKSLIALTLAVLFGLAIASSVLASNGQPKVEICHKEKNTLSVAAPAVPAHLAHGDTLGACGSNGGGGGDDGGDLGSN